MAHHRRKRAKSRRAGCLLCKPNKMAGWPKHKALGHGGFGKLRAAILTASDLRAALNDRSQP